MYKINKYKKIFSKIVLIFLIITFLSIPVQICSAHSDTLNVVASDILKTIKNTVNSEFDSEDTFESIQGSKTKIALGKDNLNNLNSTPTSDSVYSVSEYITSANSSITSSNVEIDFYSYNLEQKNAPKEDNTIKNILNQMKKKNETFAKIIDNSENYKLQVLYTEIKRENDGTIKFIPHKYNVDKEKYFYPASTVKLAAALTSIHKINSIGGDLDAVIYGSQYDNSLRFYIYNALVNSDNLSFDALFDFVGYEEFNNLLWEKGFDSAKIFHRLYSDLDGNISNNIKVLNKNGDIIYSNSSKISNLEMTNSNLKNLLVGKAYFDNGEFFNQPFNFTYKNTISIEDLQNLLKQIFFRDTLSEEQKFNLKYTDVEFLKQKLIENDGSQKWLICGGQSQNSNNNIHIYDKSGVAYGFLTDNAYITDNNGNEFLLTATIYCNNDGVINSDNYDYESEGMPFLKELGLSLLNLTKENNKNTNR